MVSVCLSVLCRFVLVGRTNLHVMLDSCWMVDGNKRLFACLFVQVDVNAKSNASIYTIIYQSIFS